jgi:hypothetical protein
MEHNKSDLITIFLYYFYFVLQDMILQYITGALEKLPKLTVEFNTSICLF